MIGEGVLNADAVKDLPHGEASPGAAAPGADDNAVEHLRAFSPAFNNLEADPDGVARPELSNIGIGLNVHH